MGQALLWAMGGTGFTFFMTALGAAMVFLFKNEIHENAQRLFLGFASGVMMAASVWSLLLPAMEEAAALGQLAWIPAAGGFALGGLFMLLIDHLLPHMHLGETEAEGLPSSMKRSTMLMLAVTLHNIPEGMAVGLAFSLAAQSGSESAYAGAMALALGMGIQNFPEGAAISLPLRKEGMSKWRAFLRGSLSGLVELVFGTLTVLVAGSVLQFMPWLLAFAAGAMIYVVVEELIPEAARGSHSNVGTIGAMAGFIVMMVLDVTLG